MSGTLGVMLAAFGGAAQPLGFLASISNSNGTAVDNPRIVLKNGQLNMSVESYSALNVRQLTVLGLGLDGTISWQTALADGTSYQYGNSVAIDSAGNVVVAGGKYNISTSVLNGYVTKLNSSGAVQWQRQISGNTVFYGVAVDTSDSIYCTGSAYLISSTVSDVYLAKFNSAGTVQYRRNIGSSSFNEAGYSIASLSASYVGIAGIADVGNYDAMFYLADPSAGTGGGITQKDAGGSGRQEASAITRGESDNIAYYGIQTYATLSPASLINTVLVKWQLGPGVVWQAQLAVSGASLNIAAVCMDPTGTYVYACGYATNTSPTQAYIAKYVAATGSVVWQRTLNCPTASLSPYAIATDSLDNVYVSIDQSSAGLVDRVLLLKMPGSGAGVGNSTALDGRTYTYAASTFSAATGALVATTYTPANSSSSATILTPTGTSSANTLSIDEQPL